MAYAELALKPAEFFDLTLRQFGKLVKGYEDRRRLEQERMVEEAALLLTPHSKRGVKASQLLNRATVHEIRTTKRKARAKRLKGEG